MSSDGVSEPQDRRCSTEKRISGAARGATRTAQVRTAQPTDSLPLHVAHLTLMQHCVLQVTDTPHIHNMCTVFPD